MAKLDNRVGFVVSDAEREALKVLGYDEDSEAALLRRLIRDEAKRKDIWGRISKKYQRTVKMDFEIE